MSVPELAPGGALRSLPASAGTRACAAPTALGADAGAPLRDPAFPPHTYPRELPRRRLNSRSPQEACPSLRGTPCRLTVATYGMT
jgi:hypothetical protein